MALSVEPQANRAVNHARTARSRDRAPGLGARHGRARFAKVEVRDRRPALAVAEGFRQAAARRRPSTGFGRRAKYLLADLSSGDVLLMHLGMSGSFRVGKDGDARRLLSRARPRARAHDHVVFHMSNGATVTFNDPRRFGSMKLVPRAKLDDEPLLRALGPEPLGNEFDAAMLAQGLRRQEDVPEGGAAATSAWSRASATSMSARRCYRAQLSPKRQASTIADRNGKPNERARRAGRGHQGGAARRHQGRRLVAARPPPRRRLARRLPAQFPGLRPRGRAVPAAARATIKRIVQTGRSTSYCPMCQK